MNKTAQLAKLLPYLLAGAKGSRTLTPLARGALSTGLGAGGYYAGTHVTPKLMGYEDVAPAQRASGGLLGIDLAALPFAALRYGPKGIFSTLAAGAASEATFPQLVASMSRSSKATQDLAKATAAGGIPPSLQGAMTGNIAKGVGGGAAAAGLAAIISGLARRKSDEEERKGRNHVQMIGTDFLRYALPAMAAGGVIGSLRGTPASAVTT